MVYFLWYSRIAYISVHKHTYSTHTHIDCDAVHCFWSGVHSSASSVFIRLCVYFSSKWLKLVRKPKKRRSFLCLFVFFFGLFHFFFLFRNRHKTSSIPLNLMSFVKIYTTIYYGPLYVISHKFKQFISLTTRHIRCICVSKIQHTWEEIHISKVRSNWIIE